MHTPKSDMELCPNTDLERDLDICKDDLPLKANTNHMLVQHYELDLTAHFDREVISGSIVLFLEAGKGPNPAPSSTEFTSGNEGPVSPLASDAALRADRGCFHGNSRPSEGVVPEWEEGEGSGDRDSDFVLVLDCCDLAVQKVEELDVAAVPAMRVLLSSGVKGHADGALSDTLVRELIAMPSSQWRLQLDLFAQCSRAPAPPAGGDLQFHTDRWSLQISKSGVHTPHAFPLAVRIWYQTKPEGASVSWTRDQTDRPCVYTQGSPINNRSLFPCQEPPVAMSTWKARVRAPSECVVLMSGENQACPVPEETGFSCWEYYVTMPMPASTFTIAIGQWVEATASASAAMTDLRTTVDVSGLDPCLGGRLEHKCSPQDVESDSLSVAQTPCSGVEHTSLSQVDCSGLMNPDCCSHMDYPCRFSDPTARVRAVIGHRVFASPSLRQRAESMLLPLLPSCLAAAHHHLGVHPFSRLDVLIVPPGFSSLGMASPHIVFLAQSVLSGENALCGARLCHEVAHAWFGLAIGARDWTEEWISEGFATYLEDVFWATVKQKNAGDEAQLKALLRWRRLKDELHNSVEELQILRPLHDATGAVSESGSSVVKHALNPEKPFMQVHYLKGYFLLKFLASKMGEEEFLRFMRLFVNKYHGQLILSQDFLRMLFEKFPHVQSPGFTLEAVYSDWLDRPGIPETLEGESEGWFRSSLVEEVKVEAVKWVEFGSSRVKRGKRRRLGSKLSSRELTPEQLVLLLELLLEEAELSVTSLRTLERTYGLRGRDAEVRHRWCELVVKHRHAAAYGDVERFLLEDQAMGVYLYGELMVNEDAEQQALAKLCFSRAQRLMDSSTRQLVQEMIL